MRSLIPSIISLSGVAAAFAVLLALRSTSRRGPKRSPLMRDLLRSPGYSLRGRVEDLSLALMSDVMCMALMSSFAALIFSMADRRGGVVWMDGAAAALLIGGLMFFAIGLKRRWKRRTHLWLALDGEMATGEELNLLMLRGCRAFHDVPADRFNIDHVVVGPGGVFAVETKARPKAPRGAGAQGATVTYDGHLLHFPGRQEREPLDQAKRQAEWLRRWLSSAVGEPVDVKPALALPGWFVDRKAPGDAIVSNPKNAAFLAEPRDGKALPAQRIQRIAHHLEQRCRDVAPLAFPNRHPESPRPSSTR